MQFLIDAQLSPLLKQVFINKGYRCIHTSELPKQNLTTDSDLNKISIEENFILISKDTDFFYSFLLHQKPYKLILVSTGNLRLSETRQLFEKHLDDLLSKIESNKMLEIDKNGVKILA